MGGYTKITAIPQTGRTHQIRFHCLDAGFPIIGDKKYFRLPRQMPNRLALRQITKRLMLLFRSNFISRHYLYACL